MRLLALSGQREAALAQYKAYRQNVTTELGVEPSEEIQETYELLLKGELPSRPPTAIRTPEREPRVVGECPYRGLAAFREVDAPFFFGREDFTERLIEAVHERPLVAVIVGSSGSGKSSAVFAGLLPRLRADEDWLIADFRPGGQPFQANTVRKRNDRSKREQSHANPREHQALQTARKSGIVRLPRLDARPVRVPIRVQRGARRAARGLSRLTGSTLTNAQTDVQVQRRPRAITTCQSKGRAKKLRKATSQCLLIFQ
jgi:hypothetical protein